MTCEDLYADRQWKVCHAFATFVARRTGAGKVTGEGGNNRGAAQHFDSRSARVLFLLGSQVQLKQVIPHTQMEQMEYSLAAERRRMRLIHAEIITDLLSSSTAQLGIDIRLCYAWDFKI